MNRADSKSVSDPVQTDLAFGLDTVTEAEVAGLEEAALLGHARAAKDACPVSHALQGTEITLEARLL